MFSSRTEENSGNAHIHELLNEPATLFPPVAASFGKVAPYAVDWRLGYREHGTEAPKIEFRLMPLL